ncbi:hypothetical protein C1H76_9043 [Elsinoe australis]|uniref:Uncharacterized protein n=1 Tax=Elsinoe australis TaxID=40998 RepID=A0A4V6DT12_9PEZI|nr:hypothetical protein C1H76_9043 [Elsinoe australis]
MAAAHRCVSVLENLSRSLNINLSAAPEGSNNGLGTDGSLYANAPDAQNDATANDPVDSSTLGQLNVSTDLALPLNVEQSFDMLFQQMQNFEGDWTTADFGNLNFEV